jgi:hypothetical protein
MSALLAVGHKYLFITKNVIWILSQLFATVGAIGTGKVTRY